METLLKPGDEILWIRFSAFGDVLQTMASAHHFKRKYPDVRLTFLTQPQYIHLLKAQPYVDDTISWDVKHRLWDFFKIVRIVRKANFDWVFAMHRNGAAAMLSLFSGVKRRFGYNRGLQFCYKTTQWEAFDALKIDFRQRDEPSVFAAPEDAQKAASLLSALPDKKLFAVIGASKPQKFWPVQHWKEFLREIVGRGWGVVLNGHGKAESETARELETELGSPAVLNLVGQLPFHLMAAVARACTAAAGNDTGPLHLAALSGTPTLGFFGVTDPHRVGMRMSWFRDVRVTCPNAGCYDYNCPKQCLADITPAKALRAFWDFAEAIE